ncbi:DUF4232 domain-containing protein [Promicromonospora kroppenstedtii]|uniref:DUF4232 domain-containing protein n=1 Tax=Promicromonospora kroppenstedtii TaxID=440482 RepID=UPI0004B7708D|nr:DUF4232 domain-containing protein [Promicromonospora kroppenstedtii]
MPPLHRVLSLAVVSVLALAGCTPSADVPPVEVTSAADAVRELPGVDDVAVTRTPRGAEPVQGNFGQRSEPAPSTVSVEVALTGTLEPRAAGEAAGEAHRLLVAAAGRVDDRENITMASSFVGGPGLGVSAGPATTSEVVADAVEDGFGLLAAGATTVDLSLGGRGDGSWDDDPLAATAHVSAATRDDFLEIARAAEELDRGVELQAPGVLYRAATRVPDVDAVRLLVAAAARPGVVDATYLAQEQRITLQSEAKAGSQDLADLRRWLDTQDYATADHPVAYTVMDAAYAETTGWVSGVEPAGYAPHTLDPFGDAEPWLEDPSAPDCTGPDLAVTFGAVDSAAGTRGGSVRATNVSGGPCAVENVPDLVFENEVGQPQKDVTIEPYEPGVMPGRVVVPDGGTVLAPLLWHAMSTANDPDTTTTIEVTAVPGAEPVPLDVTTDGTPATGLDVLDGAEVRVGPWTQGD